MKPIPPMPADVEIAANMALDLLQSAATRALPHCVDKVVGDALDEGARARDRMLRAIMTGNVWVSRYTIRTLLHAIGAIDRAADRHGRMH